MKQNNRRLFLKLILLIFLCVNHGTIHAQVIDSIVSELKPKLVLLNLDSSSYQGIFQGAPETVGMYSGLVTLAPGETVGHHNTEEYEEMLVIFSGEGQMIFTNRQAFDLKYGVVVYCPPRTEHDVKNTGKSFLKYLYIAAQTR